MRKPMSEDAKWLDLKRCGCCGKEFSVLYPDLWRFKRRGPGWFRFYCSWKCYRATEEKKGSVNMEQEKKGKSQVETGKKLVEIMEAGGDPMKYLEETGYTNTEKAYQNIKYRCKAEAPEIYARFPKKRGGRKAREPKEEPEAEAGGAFEQIREEILKAPAVKVPQEEVKPTDMWTTTAIRNEELGEFYHDTVHRSVDWRHPYGEEISLPPDVWQRLWEELPGILRAIGVK